eukprot:TRINITY_DN46284_c0_g1_i1.p1 TRINITY_DN46284_c0_g1~~TRINITY_DN46284_c0_g1_i1.p1  ORF type:complete len:558 (-),score=125.43 TRINITY_DN46284_c0_g1_i1:130-1803(-)
MANRDARKRTVSVRTRLSASHWCSIGAVAVLGLAAALAHTQGQLDDADISGAMQRRLQFFDDLLITKPCCKIPIGEKLPRATYNLAPIGEKCLVFVHVIVIGYMLLGLNTVCDVYFTGSLDVMVEKWNVKPDVAGATFMAAGGSAPELFTSIIGATITTNDVGFSTIVGSAVFNVLFVIGACGLFALKPIKLTWWPLFRDCSFYIIGLTMLALFSRSPYPFGYIEWWEALVLFLLYIAYCVMMYFNENVEAKFKGMLSNLFGESKKKTASNKVAPEVEVEETEDKNRLRDAGDATESPPTEVKGFMDQEESTEPAKVKAAAPEEAPPETKIEPVEQPEDVEEAEEEEDGIEEMMIKPEGLMAQIMWYMSLPIYGPLYYLTPKPESMFLVTFSVSLAWIAFYSFFLVYCVEVLGEVIGIPVVVMGFTLLAAGTSIPDLVSSVAVARAGEGDMAVSSSIGSNIFDILVGLPIPWMLKILVVDPIAGKGTPPIPIAGFIVFYVLVLLFMVFMVIVSIHLIGWKLHKCLGLAMGILYVMFLATALSVEFLAVNYDLSFLKF